MIRLAMLGLYLLAIGVPAYAADETTAENCSPQPDCRLAYSKNKPGAPTGGIKDKGALVLQGKSESHETVGASKANEKADSMSRETFHVPSREVDKAAPK